MITRQTCRSKLSSSIAAFLTSSSSYFPLSSIWEYVHGDFRLETGNKSLMRRWRLLVLNLRTLAKIWNFFIKPGSLVLPRLSCCGQKLMIKSEALGKTWNSSHYQSHALSRWVTFIVRWVSEVILLKWRKCKISEGRFKKHVGIFWNQGKFWKKYGYWVYHEIFCWLIYALTKYDLSSSK